jgi:CopG family transcriptional regulator, nickel-responsive regulator
MGLLRAGVAIDSDLLKRFDRFIRSEGYESRSEAIRDLIRDRLNQLSLKLDTAFVVGTITLIYNHHSRLLPDKLMELQHEYHELIISTVHSHLDHDMCLEAVVVRGVLKRVQELADRLIGIKGVQHGKLVISSPEAYLAKPARVKNGPGRNAAHHRHK